MGTKRELIFKPTFRNRKAPKTKFNPGDKIRYRTDYSFSGNAWKYATVKEINKVESNGHTSLLIEETRTYYNSYEGKLITYQANDYISTYNFVIRKAGK